MVNYWIEFVIYWYAKCTSISMKHVGRYILKSPKFISQSWFTRSPSSWWRRLWKLCWQNLPNCNRLPILSMRTMMKGMLLGFTSSRKLHAWNIAMQKVSTRFFLDQPFCSVWHLLWQPCTSKWMITTMSWPKHWPGWRMWKSPLKCFPAQDNQSESIIMTHSYIVLHPISCLYRNQGWSRISMRNWSMLRFWILTSAHFDVHRYGGVSK